MKTDKCRICKSHGLNMFLDLGNHPMADTFIEADYLSDKENYNPLQVCSCSRCGLIQLKICGAW